MATVLIPKYSLGQISSNYFARTTGVSVDDFIKNNFTSGDGSISSKNPQTISNQPQIDLLSGILVDYGNGIISTGIQSLQIINKNVNSQTPSASDIFNNQIIYGQDIDFSSVTSDQGRVIVLGNLNMLQVINLVSPILQNSYYVTIDNIVTDLKAGTFSVDTYSATLLTQSKQIAQAALRVVNGTNI
jgi:hypothetical protein